MSSRPRIAVLGSIVTAMYRSGIVDAVPSGLPADAVAAARDTLGGAVDAARALGPAGDGLLQAARDVYVATLEKAAWICAGLSLFATCLILALEKRLGMTAAAEAAA